MTSLADAAKPDAPGSGTKTRTTSPIPLNAAIAPPPMPLSPAPLMWCAGATSSPASRHSTWSRAVPSAPMTKVEDRYTLYADVNYPHRVRNMLANMVFKVPESKVRVVVPRCRRRLRRQGLAICRSSPDPVGRQETGTPGQVEVRAVRGHPRGRARPRQYRRNRTRTGQGRKIPRPAPEYAGQHRRLYRVRPPTSDAVRPDRNRNGRV